MITKKISAILIISFALLSSHVYSQFPENWSDAFQFTTTNGYSNEARKIATDASGNTFVLMDITSNIDSLGQPASTTQYYVVLRKYSFSGNFIAQKIVNANNMVLSGHDYKASFGMELDASGNVYIGYTKYNSATNYDIGVTKFTNALVLSWNYVYTTGGLETGVDMKLRGTTPYVLFKTTSGANTTYSVTKASANGTSSSPLYSFVTNTDVVNSMTTADLKNLFFTGYSLVGGVKTLLTAMIAPAGVEKWKKTYNHNSVTGDDYGSKVLIGDDGDIYVSGTTYTSAANGNDALVLQYGYSGGNILRQLQIDRGPDDIGANIANGPSGYLFETLSHGNVINICRIQANSSAVVVSNSTHYNPIPGSPYTSLTGVSITDMKIAASNNVYVCGSVTGNSASGSFSASWLCKVGFSGSLFTLLNSQDVTGDFNFSEHCASMALDAAHNNILTVRSVWGNYNSHNMEIVYISNLIGGTLRLNGSGSSVASNDSEISFYPNPASGEIFINTTRVITLVEICDLTGKVLIITKPFDSSMDISMLKPGLYLARVITESGSEVKRIVVQ